MEQLDLSSSLFTNKDSISIKQHDTTPRNAPPSLTMTPLPAHIPTLIALVGQMRQELESQLTKLFSLNPGRRETIFQYLMKLSGQNPFSHLYGKPEDSLKNWINQLHTPAQENALRTFFEEVALITLGQALLLKIWSERGIRVLKTEDLVHLNWALSSALKPFLPTDRESWQITRPNLYSWYNPSAAIQRDLWKAFEAWNITEESPLFLIQIFKLVRQFQPAWPEVKGYDPRFFSTLWEQISNFGFQTEIKVGPLKRRAVAFTPTLRDGAFTLAGPPSVTWIGLEQNPFHLFIAELCQLWRGPSAPPLWSLGNGLEVFGRDQLSLAIGSPKPSLHALITEIEACDLAFVLEERTIRVQNKTLESQELREKLELSPSLKKLKSPQTSLGNFQTAVALHKLRPGGLLWLLRDEPLSTQDGKEFLNFVLEKSKLLCEWNFSEISHGLPVLAPLFPKYLYLFQKELSTHDRLEHRPTRITTSGQIRSHIEVPLFLSEALLAYHQLPQNRDHWQIHSQVSPTTQKDWSELWPDPAQNETILALEEFKRNSMPLASFTTVRTHTLRSADDGSSWNFIVPKNGILLSPDPHSQNTKLLVKPILSIQDHAHETGFVILLSQADWIIPLSSYLQSEWVKKWLDFNAERKNGKWVLSEQLLKFIPIPKNLLNALSGDTLLPQEWKNLVAEISYKPKEILEKIKSQFPTPEIKEIQAHLFIETSKNIHRILKEQGKLLSLIHSNGQINWKSLLEILPASEFASATFCSEVLLSGSMPSHVPITRFEKIKSPIPGILFSTESGLHMSMGSHNPKLLEILWDQLQDLVHPTWNELIQILKLPRQLAQFEATVLEIIKSHSIQSQRIKNLNELLCNCINF